jgi:hypothetical protein
VLDVIRRYTPAHVDEATWNEIADVVRSVIDQATVSEPTARKYLSHFAAYAAWSVAQGVPAALPQLLDAATIERYIEIGMPDAKDGTRGTRRSILRRIAQHAHPDLSLAPDAKPLAYRRIRPPYAAQEIASYFRLADAQPTQGRRDSLRAVLALGLGCGLDCGDLGWVRGIDVRETEHGVEVDVAGRRPRRVICLSRYEDPLTELATTAAEKLLIGGAQLGRRNVTSVTLGRLLQDKSVPPLVVSRLRSTWLTAHLAANTPLPVIMGAAGLRTVRPLEDLLDHVPAYSASEATRALRSAG